MCEMSKYWNSELFVATFGRGVKFTTLGNLDRRGRLVAGLGLGVFDLLHHIVSLKDLAKDDVAAIQPAIYVSSSTPAERELWF